MRPVTIPKLIISDWDETVTVRDTIATVAQVAYTAKPEYPKPFDHYVNVYTQLYKAYVSDWRSKGNQYPTVDLESEEEFQRHFHQVEVSSVKAIETDGLFKDVPVKSFNGVTVDIDQGFKAVALEAAAMSIPLVILSINWTELIIYNTLRKHKIPVLKVIVNRLQTNTAKDRLTGSWDPRWEIRTAFDKRRWVQRLMKEHNIAKEDIWYVGDSLTDLLAMLETQVPVMVPTGRGLGKALDLGLRVLPLSTAVANQKCIYEGTWEDVLDLLHA
ncbi:uncharacterized protein KQ657_000263 [Scheffersomyces spartinae]|uniref:Uncharacterized protein n=1 Tax=Scheffersomyces spartinae TaxID=45513 RepID=A0A9P7VEA9_9ASCO|nr:uncharacterized protein KQ657_000263 [Scheffersomyces spartinae]KAG7196250.1 hypothetical protein KQ657_000263 [Scheffersomyces spartinae]